MDQALIDRLAAALVLSPSDSEELAAFVAEIRKACPTHLRLGKWDARIGDPEFSAAALAMAEGWITVGTRPGA